MHQAYTTQAEHSSLVEVHGDQADLYQAVTLLRLSPISALSQLYLCLIPRPSLGQDNKRHPPLGVGHRWREATHNLHGRECDENGVWRSSHGRFYLLAAWLSPGSSSSQLASGSSEEGAMA